MNIYGTDALPSWRSVGAIDIHTTILVYIYTLNGAPRTQLLLSFSVDVLVSAMILFFRMCRLNISLEYCGPCTLRRCSTTSHTTSYIFNPRIGLKFKLIIMTHANIYTNLDGK